MGTAKTTVEIDVGEGAKSLRSLKKEFKDVQQELNDTTIGSEKYISTLQKLGGVKEEIKNLNQQITDLRPDQKLQAFVGVGRGLAAGFEAATGAAALFGSEAKDVEKAMLKIQAAMALANAVQEVGELGKQFKNLGIVLKAAFASNPFGAILVAVTAIAGIIGGIYDKYFSTVALAKEELEAQKEITNAARDKLSFIERMKPLMELQGKTAKEILSAEIKATNELETQIMIELQKQIAVREAQTKTAEANNIILKGVLEFISAPLTLILGTIDKISGWVGEQTHLVDKVFGGIANKVFNVAETKKEGDKEVAAIVKTLEDIKIKRANFALQEKKADEEKHKYKAEIKAKEKVVKIVAEKEEKEKHKYKAEIKAKEKVVKIVAEKEEKAEKEKAQIDNYKLEEKAFNDEIKLAELHIKKLKKLHQDTDKEEIKLARKKYDRILNDEKASNAEILIAKEEFETTKTEIEEREGQRRAQIQAAQFQIAQQGTNALMSLSTLLMEKGQQQTEFQKGIAVTQIAIDTAKAIAGAISAGASEPYPLNIVAIISGVAAVLANVVKAKQLLEESGAQMPALPSAGGSGGGSGGSPKPPQLNGVGNTSTLLFNQQNKSSTPPPPIKTYVVETESTASQKRISRIEQKTKF